MNTQSSLPKDNPAHTFAWILVVLFTVDALGWMGWRMDWIVKWLLIMPFLEGFIVASIIFVVGLFYGALLRGCRQNKSSRQPLCR